MRHCWIKLYSFLISPQRFCLLHRVSRLLASTVLLVASPSSPVSPSRPAKMCEYTKNYYIYTSCVDPGAHFFSTSMDGKKERRCSRGPHERYIVVPGHCPLCGS